MQYTYLNPKHAKTIPIVAGTTVLTDPSILYIGNKGNIKVKPAISASAVTFNNVSNCTVLPLIVTHVYGTSSGTTASGIIAMW